MSIKNLLSNTKTKQELEECRDYYELCEYLQANDLSLNCREIDIMLSFYLKENKEQSEYLTYHQLDNVCGGGQGNSKASGGTSNVGRYQKTKKATNAAMLSASQITEIPFNTESLTTHSIPDERSHTEDTDYSLTHEQTTNPFGDVDPESTSSDSSSNVSSAIYSPFFFCLSGRIYSYNEGLVNYLGTEESAFESSFDGEPKEVFHPVDKCLLPPSAYIESFDPDPDSMPQKNVFFINGRFCRVNDGMVERIETSIPRTKLYYS